MPGMSHVATGDAEILNVPWRHIKYATHCWHACVMHGSKQYASVTRVVAPQTAVNLA